MEIAARVDGKDRAADVFEGAQRLQRIEAGGLACDPRAAAAARVPTAQGSHRAASQGSVEPSRRERSGRLTGHGVSASRRHLRPKMPAPQ